MIDANSNKSIAKVNIYDHIDYTVHFFFSMIMSSTIFLFAFAMAGMVPFIISHDSNGVVLRLPISPYFGRIYSIDVKTIITWVSRFSQWTIIVRPKCVLT
jgi:hypothetical protein